MSQTLMQLSNIGILCSCTPAHAEDAVSFAKAIVAGNLPYMELPYSESLGATVAAVRSAVPEVGIAVSGITSLAQAQLVIDAAADLMLVEGLSSEIQKLAEAKDIAVLPVLSTKEDVQKAQELGYKACVLQSPKENFGGVVGVKAVAEEMKDVSFVIRSLASDEDFISYLDIDAVMAVTEPKLFADVQVEGVEHRALQLFSRIMDFDVGHVGINAGTEDNANAVTNRIMQLFGTDKRETPLAFFSGKLVEVMKRPFVGQCGHICVDTRDLKRAMAMLERKGVTFNPDLYMYNAKGELMTVYLNEEIGGFAFHVRQRPRQ